VCESYFAGSTTVRVVQLAPPLQCSSAAMAHSPSKVHAVLRAVCERTSADYAIFWLPIDDQFAAFAQYNPPERIEALQQQRGDEDTFSRGSSATKLEVNGTSFVARVFRSGEDALLTGAQQLASPSFMRAELAKTFGIQSVACVAYDSGVLEYGTTKPWDVLPKAFPDVHNEVQVEVGQAEDESGNPAEFQKLTYWKPEDAAFWAQWGKRIAWKNLLISIPNLLLMFATWIMWSIVVTTVQAANDATGGTAYRFADLGLSPGDTKGYKASLFMLPSIAGLAGATLRVPNSFMVASTGGQVTNAMNSTLAILPMVGIALAFRSTDCPFWLLCILAPCCGFGGGAFASSMSGISFFFPRRDQGMALGLNAGIGNLGVSVTQLVLPVVCSSGIFGAGSVGGKYVMNSGWFYAILLTLAAAPAWLRMNYMPNHGSPVGSMLANVLAYLRLEGLGFIGVACGTALFVLSTPLVAGSPALIILRIFVLAIVACLVTLASMWFLSSSEIKAKLRVQAQIFSDKHTWLMTWLYIMTFGSFIGYSSAFPKLIKDVFGYLPDGSENPNAPSVAAFAWMGACVGSLARPVGGWLSDKWTGATVTHWGTVIEIVATVAVGIFVRLAQASSTPDQYFYPFLICFLFLFGATGSSNGSTFRQMSVMFPPEKAGPVLGWTSAVAAYGAAVFPACFGAGLQGGFVDVVLFVFAAYYCTCLGVNYWFYYRSGAERPC